MKDIEPVKARSFVISNKTSNSWLVEQRGLRQSSAMSRIAGDIIDNACELEGGINWDEILKRVSWLTYTGGETLHGQSAIANSVSVTLALVAARMGWDMHSPEVVYISGFYFLKFITKRTEILETNLVNAPTRKFISEEKKGETIGKEQDERDNLVVSKERLGESLGEYAKQTLPQDPAYLEILQQLIYIEPKMRETVIELLQKREIESAATFLKNKK